MIRNQLRVLCLLCRYQGHVSAALVLGGVDFKGPHLFTVRLKLGGLMIGHGSCVCCAGMAEKHGYPSFESKGGMKMIRLCASFMSEGRPRRGQIELHSLSAGVVG